jgi:hypothetical protein
MRTRILALGLAVVVARAASGQVVQETTTVAGPNGAVVQDRAVGVPGGMGYQRMSQIIGSNVNLQGSPNYGRVEDVMLGPDGRIHSVVVNNNGRYAMLPWNAGNYNAGRRALTYDVGPRAIEPLNFANNAWPDFNDGAYVNRMNQVFPNAGAVSRQALRPVGPDGGVIKEKVKPNGTVKVKER